MLTVSVLFFLLGFGAAAIYYNIFVNKKTITNNDVVNTQCEEKTQAVTDIKRNNIIRTVIRKTTYGKFTESKYSIDQLCVLVDKYSPTLNYNLLRIEDCTEENIKNALEFAVKMQDSILLLEHLMDSKGLAYCDDSDVIYYFDEDLPLKELTEKYAIQVIDNFLKETNKN